MAKTAINVSVTPSSAWTVPTGKFFIGKAFNNEATHSGGLVLVDGVAVTGVSFQTSGGENPGPLVANTGAVYSISAGATSYGLSGWLYDNPTSRVAVNQSITSTPYVIPTGYYFIGSALRNDPAFGEAIVTVNSVPIGSVAIGTGGVTVVAPFSANAADSIAKSTGVSFGLVGWLYPI